MWFALAASAVQDNYTFAQCKRVLPVSAVRGLGVPLPAAEVELLEENLTWDDIQVLIRNHKQQGIFIMCFVESLAYVLWSL
jgi:hypothetical protein